MQAKINSTQHIQIGQPATLSVDALNDQILTGRVSEISPATGAEFSVIQADTGTGNFVKIPQRIAIKIQLDPNQQDLTQLKAGMSVIAKIRTK